MPHTATQAPQIPADITILAVSKAPGIGTMVRAHLQARHNDQTLTTTSLFAGSEADRVLAIARARGRIPVRVVAQTLAEPTGDAALKIHRLQPQLDTALARALARQPSGSTA